MKKIKYGLRWVFVLPGAIIAGFLSTFPLHWILMLYPTGRENMMIQLSNDTLRTIEYVLFPFIIALTFIFVGYKIAPKYKFKTAIVLFGIYLLIWLIASFVTLYKGSLGNISLQFSGRTLLALAGAFIGLYLAKKTQEESKTK